MPALDEWKRLFRDLDPLRELQPHEVQALYAERPDSASQEIAEELRWSVTPADVRVLLAGARGSGKTTELHRLFQTFHTGEPVVVPIYVDIARVLPEHATTRSWLPILAAAIRAVREAWSPPDHADHVLQRAVEALGVGGAVWSAAVRSIGVLARWSRAPAKAAAGVAAALIATSKDAPMAAPLVGAVASEATDVALRNVEAILAPSRPAQDGDAASLKALIAAMRAELEAISAAAGCPALLLLDGLDKRSSAESVLAALDEAELLYQLPAALVVSGPMQLSLDPGFAAQLVPGRFRCVVHHNLPVVDKEGAEKRLGSDVLLDLFQRRWRGMGLAGEPVLSEALVREAARWSSGVVREFLELVRGTCRFALRAQRDAATQEDLRRAVRDRRMDFERTITTELWDQLEHVYETRERPRADVDELVFTNRVACYPNDGTWFRPNELLIPHLQERMQRRRDKERMEREQAP